MFAKLDLAALLWLLSVLLPSLGLPGGLVGLFGQLVLIWSGLAALRLVLRRYMPEEQVEGYWLRAVAPLFVVVALAGLEEGNRKAFELILRHLLIGLNGRAIAAIAGGLSVGLGFGIKEVFSNFVSGIWQLFEGALQPGEVLFDEGDVCKVREMGLRAATLKRKSDNAELVVPNQSFFTATTTTYTGTEELRCGFLKVRALADPCPSAAIVNLGEYASKYGVDFWMVDPMKNGKISGELRRAILLRFKEEGIEIPRPPYVSSPQA